MLCENAQKYILKIEQQAQKASWQIIFNIQIIQKGAKNYGKGFLYGIRYYI